MIPSVRLTWLLLVAGTVIAVLGLWRLDYQDNPRDLYLRAGPESDLLEQMYESFGSDDNTVMVMVQAKQPIFSGDLIKEMKPVVDRLQELPEIEEVNSLFSLRRQRVPILLVDPDRNSPQQLAEMERLALQHPLARGLLLSEDGHSTILLIRLAGKSLNIAHMQEALENIEQLVTPLRKLPGIQLFIGGPPTIRVESLARIRVEQFKFSIIGGLSSLCIAIFIFRQWQAIGLGMLGPTIGVVWTMGAMGWMDQRIDGIKIIIPSLLFVIGFTDSVHLVMGLGRLQTKAKKRLSSREAAYRTLKELGGACLMTSLTTAAGFGSLMLSGTTSVQRFGFCCAIGAMLLFLAVVLTFWALAASPFGAAVINAKPFAKPPGLRRRQPTWLRAIRRILRFPKTTVAVSIIACLVMGATCVRLEPNIFWTESIAKGSPTMRSVEELDRHFGGTAYGAVLVRWPAEANVASPQVINAMAATHKVIREESRFGVPLSIANVLASADFLPGGYADRWAALQRRPEFKKQARRLVVDEEGDDLPGEAVIYFLTADVGANALKQTLEKVNRSLQNIETETGVSLTLGGTPVVAGNVFTNMIQELAISLAVASVLVFVIISIPLRSLTLGLASLLPNAFPLLVAGFAIYWTTGYLTLTNTLTFCLCLGIAVDDTIHFLKQYRDSRLEGHSIERSVLISLRRVGRVLLLSSLILVVGMAGMLASETPPLRIFAMLAMLAILTALIGDLIILPAILLCTANRRKKT
ncbi:efflux RND transporter permease subunit [Roseimaritima multifibrata]|uniref:efflux RND transporter permease subunit n=1 Tax=Roseimaritima multifibrata TaxID=1930274 RepID=UPI0011A78D24|nr:MMPL family transporter [Roseimaritima multifibrata]